MARRSPVRHGVSRRDFLAVGGMSLAGLPVAERLQEARRRGSHRLPSGVLILLTGGPSPWETFDPKPEAPREIRGPLRSISTALPGVAFCETLPRLAQRVDQFSVIRSLYHDEAPIHETGLQLLQAGALVRGGQRPPALGRLVAAQAAGPEEVPPYVLLGGGLHKTGTSASPGDAGAVASKFQGPLVVDAEGGVESQALATTDHPIPQRMTDVPHESRETRERYGDTRIGQMLLQARQLLEQGVRFVTVNGFSRLEGERTWDAHGCAQSAPATLFDYQNWIGPQFDQAMAAFLDDLRDRGMWPTTRVLCCGEIGRTPLVNPHGGRDHWTRGFSGLVAGGGAPEGEIVGRTSLHGGEIEDAPVSLSDLAHQMKEFLGVAVPPEGPGAESAAPGTRSLA